MNPSRSARTVNRLLVEGIDDQEVISHVLRYGDFKLTEKNAGTNVSRFERQGTILEVKRKENKGQLFKSLRLEAEATDVLRLAMIVDCDHEEDHQPIESPWRSFVVRAGALGYQCPSDAPENGAIVLTEDRPPLGIWIMPDNSAGGMLEDFVAGLIENNDELWPLAKAAVPEPTLCRFRPVHRRKAEVHTWLAWQEQPGVKMGSAIHRRYLNPQLPIGQAFLDWVLRWLNAPSDC